MTQIITPQELEEMRSNKEDFIIVDVLTHGMYKKQHVPGAINIPVDQCEELMPKIANTNKKIVLYCYDTACEASPKAAKILEKVGYTNLFDMEVGIVGYKEAGFTAHQE